jgi:hypothetical protein
MHLVGVGEFPTRNILRGAWELADIVQHGKACEQAQRTIKRKENLICSPP